MPSNNLIPCLFLLGTLVSKPQGFTWYMFPFGYYNFSDLWAAFLQTLKT